MESNSSSLEIAIVRIVRQLTARESRMVEAPGGLEFWSEKNGNPFLARSANVGFLIQRLAREDVTLLHRFPTEFWDVNRFPAGIARKAAVQFNRMAFSRCFLSFLSAGNGIIGQKGNVKMKTWS